VPASPARGVACHAKELMRRDGRFVGRLLRVREPFEEQKDSFTFEFEFRDGFGRSFGWISPGPYILGRGAGGGSLPCHLRLPSALVSAT
jgi:hypothetical protein